MPRRKAGKLAMSAGGKKSGGSDVSTAGSTNAAKIRRGGEAALGEFGASMMQRFGRRAPPGTYTHIDMHIHLTVCVGRRAGDEGGRCNEGGGCRGGDCSTVAYIRRYVYIYTHTYLLAHCVCVGRRAANRGRGSSAAGYVCIIHTYICILHTHTYLLYVRV